MVKAIFFDVANTLLYKPAVYSTIVNVLNSNGNAVDRGELEYKHKLLSEIVEFPDQTNEQFYSVFNSHLLLALGIDPTDTLIHELFKKCSYLPWEPFPDSDIVGRLTVPIGIISNWDSSLKEKLSQKINGEFKWILGSEEFGLRKPDERFFLQIIEQTKLNPDEIIVVGDSIRLDILPATKLGMQAVLVDRIDLFPNTTLTRVRSLFELHSFLVN